jgi:methyl-accepting chemotaxis protein
VSALGEIVKHVATISDTIEEIDHASQSQATGLSQVNQGMSEIDEVVHSTAASAEETSISASELSDLSLKHQAQLEKMRKIDGLIDNAVHTGGNMVEVKNVS